MKLTTNTCCGICGHHRGRYMNHEKCSQINKANSPSGKSQGNKKGLSQKGIDHIIRNFR